MSKKNIEECVRDNLEAYFRDLRGTEPGALYDMVVRAVEKPLLDVVMQHAGHNQSRAIVWNVVGAANTEPVQGFHQQPGKEADKKLWHQTVDINGYSGIT